MRKALAVAALATITIAGSTIASTTDAAAQRRLGTAIGIGIAAGLLAGAIAHGGVVYVEPRCEWVDQYDRYGNYLGRARICYAPD